MQRSRSKSFKAGQKSSKNTKRSSTHHITKRLIAVKPKMNKKTTTTIQRQNPKHLIQSPLVHKANIYHFSTSAHQIPNSQLYQYSISACVELIVHPSIRPLSFGPIIQHLQIPDNGLETVAKAVYDKLVEMHNNGKHKIGTVVSFRCPEFFEPVDYIHVVRQTENNYVLIGNQVLSSNPETRDKRKELDSEHYNDWMKSFIEQFPIGSLSFKAGCGIQHRPTPTMKEPLKVEKTGDQMVVAHYSRRSAPFIKSIEKIERYQMLEQLEKDILGTSCTQFLEGIKRIEFVPKEDPQAYEGFTSYSKPIRLTPGQKELIVEIISPLLSSSKKKSSHTVFLVDEKGNIHSEKGNGEFGIDLGCNLIDNSIVHSL